MGLLLRRFFFWAKPAFPVILDVGGFVALSIGAAMIYQPAGWLVAGAALILVAYRLES